AAFTPGNHIGLSLNYLSVADQGSDVERIKNFEIGTGFYQKLSRNLHFETYGGTGFGSVINNHYTGISKLSTNNFFLQPAISVANSRHTVQFAFHSRFNVTKFRMTDTSFNN